MNPLFKGWYFKRCLLCVLIEDMKIAGIDSCKDGWVVSHAELLEDGSLQLETQVFLHFAELFEIYGEFDFLTVDMAIGLPKDKEKRQCDKEARKMLENRSPSVVPAPPRKALACHNSEEARFCGVPIQVFNQFPKIREVDAIITPELQQKVRESNSELVFTVLNEEPLHLSKKKPAGEEERIDALKRCTLFEAVDIPDYIHLVMDSLPRGRVRRDEVIDSLALLAAAYRLYTNEAVFVGNPDQRDAKDLHMLIWA